LNPEVPGVALGVQGAQSSTSAARGLARYVVDAATAIVERIPWAVAQLSYSRDAPPPDFVRRLPVQIPCGDDANPPAWSGPIVYHVLSAFELEPLDRLWPRWARSADVALVVTVHDLIPFIYPDRYLHYPRIQRWHYPRLPFLSVADALIADSAHTARDITDRLDIEDTRIFVAGLDAGRHFRPPDRSLDEVLHAVQTALPEIRPGFLLYVGGVEYRKNLERLLVAYGRLGPDQRRRHQLVIAGKHVGGEQQLLRRLLGEMRVAADVLVTGPVSDATLVGLYQACHLFVFPSLYEGFGLPALEALRCGAAVVVADRSSLREVVTDPEARFDPESVDSIAATLRRAVTDSDFTARLRDHAASEAARFSWDRSTAEMLRAYSCATAIASMRVRP
jgi:glycosyltransferase involved in cell wall biosynthesis